MESVVFVSWVIQCSTCLTCEMIVRSKTTTLELMTVAFSHQNLVRVSQDKATWG